MERHEPLESDDGIELLKRLLVPSHGGYVIPRGKHVTGVHTDGHAVRLGDQVDNPAQLLEPVTDRCPLSGCGLENAFHPVPLCLLVNDVQRFGDSLDTFCVTCPDMRAWMKIEVLDSQNFASIKFILQRCAGLTENLRIDRAQIDQVRVVDNDGTDA